MFELNFFSFFAITAASYVTCSYIFLKFPALLHKKREFKSAELQFLLNSNKILHISHRGGSREALENTFDAFNNAANIGSNMLEMDVCLTKDQEIVVVHDPTLDRLCGVNKPVSTYNYKDLPEFSGKTFLHFSINQFFDTAKTKEKYMPKLEEVFKKFPNTLINVEIKEPTELAIHKTEELIKKYNREHLTIWGTRFIEDSGKLMQLNKNIPVFFSIERICLTYFYFLTGLLPFVKIKESSMQIPLATREFQVWKLSCENTVVGKIKTHLWFGTIKFLNLISPLLFEHLKKRGILVFYWVLNEENDYQRAINAGVTGIMTDRPSLLHEYLNKNNRYAYFYSIF